MGTRYDQSFYEQETCELAQKLLGAQLVVQTAEQGDTTGKVAGIIVETEAYLLHNDPACHASRGKTRRNATMFGPAGRLYVYSIHTHLCANIVTHGPGIGSAVLLRAIEPLMGLETLTRNRKIETQPSSFSKIEPRISNGPGKLCEGLGIEMGDDGLSLIDSPRIWLEPFVPQTAFAIRSSSRIGISKGIELPYRYFVDGNRFVGGKVNLHGRKRNESFHEQGFKLQ